VRNLYRNEKGSDTMEEEILDKPEKEDKKPKEWKLYDNGMPG